MRPFPLILLLLVVLVQYPLWLGKGGWLTDWEMQRKLENQTRINSELRTRNQSLAAEVADLREGAGAIEERARYELGMVRDGELFIQFGEPVKVVTAPAATKQP